MGWTEYKATEFTNGGRISVKGEILKELENNLSDGYEYVGGSLVGSTFYAAIKDPEGHVFCAVYLTGTSDNYWFRYKAIHERWKPTQYDCPDRVLGMLTPTDDEWTNEWREECRKRNAARKSPKAFKNLLDGTQAKWNIPFDFGPFKAGDTLTLRKGRQNPWKQRSRFVWNVVGYGFYVHPSMVKDYVIVEEV